MANPLDNLKPWKPGQSGNPAGRKKGSRNRLGEAFLEAGIAPQPKPVKRGLSHGPCGPVLSAMIKNADAVRSLLLQGGWDEHRFNEMAGRIAYSRGDEIADAVLYGFLHGMLISEQGALKSNEVSGAES